MIAAALRTELDADQEDQSGYRDPGEAGRINRAFRAVTSVILRKIAVPRNGYRPSSAAF
jgi:hypothetical protein